MGPRLERGGFSWTGPEIVLDFYLSTMLDLWFGKGAQTKFMIAKEALFESPKAWPIRKFTPWKQDINQTLLQMTDMGIVRGLISKRIKKWLKLSNDISEKTKISLIHILLPLGFLTGKLFFNKNFKYVFYS